MVGRERDQQTQERPQIWLLARASSKRYFQLFVLKKLNIHHEGHEEHEEKQRKLCNYSCFFQIPS